MPSDLSRPRAPRADLAAGGVLALAVTLAACTGTGSDGTATPTPTRTTYTATGVPSSQPVGAIASLTKKDCTYAADKGWTFSATITNNDAAEHTYKVTVAIVEQKGNGVVAKKDFTEKVGSKKVKDLKAEGFHKGGNDGLICVVGATLAQS